jgi:pimeloyl-ACP methyl ester carboxylesterase
MSQNLERSRRPAAPSLPASDTAQPPRGSVLGRALTRARRTVAGAAEATNDIVGGAARALATPTGLVGAAVEAAWLTTHVALYPWGLIVRHGADSQHGYRVEHLPPVQRGLVISDVEAAGTPILLVHGMVDNHSIFTLLRLGLRRRGFGRVTTMNYSPLTADVRVAAARLAEEVEELVAETGYERIHVVGHSMGGLIARYYITRLGGDERVHTLVTLGTPHQGTYTAYGWNNQLTKQLRPGSGLMRELDQPVPACRTRFVAYWSDLDQMIFPQRFAAIEHPDLNVRNIDLHGVGHMSLPIIGSVVHGISSTLAHLDSEGHTLTPGVTELPRRPRETGPGSGLQ